MFVESTASKECPQAHCSLLDVPVIHLNWRRRIAPSSHDLPSPRMKLNSAYIMLVLNVYPTYSMDLHFQRLSFHLDQVGESLYIQ